MSTEALKFRYAERCPECFRFLGKKYGESWCDNCKVCYPDELVITPQIMSYDEHKTQIDRDIKNLGALPGGINCKYLLTIKGENKDLIAKQWKRKQPALSDNEVLIIF